MSGEVLFHVEHPGPTANKPSASDCRGSGRRGDGGPRCRCVLGRLDGDAAVALRVGILCCRAAAITSLPSLMVAPVFLTGLHAPALLTVALMRRVRSVAFHVKRGHDRFPRRVSVHRGLVAPLRCASVLQPVMPSRIGESQSQAAVCVRFT